MHPMETHDSPYVNAGTGAVVGGEELDDAYNRHILPPINPRPSGRPRGRRIDVCTDTAWYVFGVR